ncbi:BOS complex subunit NCLN isoform X1 [Anastrepha obliqua]|uniref:BOS complex subunit NCLN isoform X1 n=1 Tax=Anastrepha obliqua TaxID=95512 RepID=UPI00240985CC|nr:BOS complex subunit NCLN isoform X1 [Anastrepha obliqua]
MLDEAENFADIFRGGLPYLLIALPILLICSANPVLASSEFSVQRMSQFDVNGVAYGCRASALSLEAKSLYTWSTGRHCVLTKLQDLTIDQFREIRQKAGGLVILLPKDVSSMTFDEKEHLNLLEQAMLAQPNSIPIYFSPYNQELERIITDVTRTSSNNVEGKSQRNSAASELFASISANGYQVIVSGASHVASKNSRIPIIQGELATTTKLIKQVDGGNEVNNKLPLIIVTSHLNTFGLYNEYPLNADAAVLLTLADLFSKMHNTPNAIPKYRLLFLLTESGTLLNFQGIKKWLDENVQLQEDLVSITGTLIAAKNPTSIKNENVDFVLCLDTITQALNADTGSLYMHVSKPPKEGTAMNDFFKLLKTLSAQYYNVTVDGVHKKINLADQQLAWEHERFSMKRLPAFTISALKSPKEPIRYTIFKDSDAHIIAQTQQHAKIIAESLAHYIYGIQEPNEIFANELQISQNLIKCYLQLKSALHNNDLKNAFEKYLKNVKIMYDKPDTRDPDFMFYDGQEARLNVYHVKPAVFDLFLTILICAYLASVYFVIQYFPTLYDTVCKMTKAPAQPAQTNSNNTKSKVY